MIQAFRQLRQDLSARKWDTRGTDPPSVMVQLRVKPDGTVTGIERTAPWYRDHLPMIRVSMGATLSLYRQNILDILDAMSADLIVGLIPSPKSTQMCTVAVKVGAPSFSAANEEWTLQVRPSDSLLPIYRGFSVIPHRVYVQTTIHLIEGDHTPDLLCAVMHGEARWQMAHLFSPFQTLCAEILPDLRYEGPRSLTTLIGEELAETVWHPERVFKQSLDVLDM